MQHTARYTHVTRYSTFAQDLTLKMPTLGCNSTFTLCASPAVPSAVTPGWSVSGVPQDHSQARLVRGTHRTQEMCLYPWLEFITAKGCRLKSTKGKSTRGKVQETPNASFQVSPPSRAMGTSWILLVAVCENTYEVLPAKGTHPNLGVQVCTEGSVM